MDILKKMWSAIQGRKTSIATIIALFITLSLTKGWIDNDWAIFFSASLTALGLSANVANYYLTNNK